MTTPNDSAPLVETTMAGLDERARELLAQAVEADGRLMLAKLIRSGQAGDEDFLIEPALAAITAALKMTMSKLVTAKDAVGLKPCPFCGTSPEAIDGAPTQFSSWIGCRHAFCCVTPFVDAPTFGEAVEIWNTRPQAAPVRDTRSCSCCNGDGIIIDSDDYERRCYECEGTGLIAVRDHLRATSSGVG